MTDWSKIEAEYIVDAETSYRKLAQKYGLNQATIAQKAKAEDWVGKRKQHASTTQARTLETDITQKVDRATKLLDVSDLLLEKVRKLIDSDDKIAMDTQGMKRISDVLKDLKEIQMIRSEPDTREQEARIAKLWREAEKDAGDKDKTVIVTIEGGDDSWRK